MIGLRPAPMSDPIHPASHDLSGPAPANPEQPGLRASDAEREQVAEILRQAAGDGRIDVDELDERLQAVYTSRTKAELAPLTADVIAARAQPPIGREGVSVRPGGGGTRSVISMMGGSDRSGHWRVASRCFVLNLMGGCDLDLNQVELADEVTTITAVSIMGGGDIRLPDGVEVHVSKLAIMGGNDVKLSAHRAPPGAPVIHLRLLSIMGGMDVRQGPKLTRAQRRRQRELRQAERGELKS
jgi:hypothetical protein